ncbi:hypothetical protein [Wolbachia endosymbiont (group A) of Agelastica alni]
MVTGKIVSAPFGTAEHWNQINWSQCKKKNQEATSSYCSGNKRWEME